MNKNEFDYVDLVQAGTFLNPETKEEKEGDMVNHPSHYCFGGIECIEAIRACLSDEEYRGYCKGCAIKYIWRERHKGGDESLKKAVWYMNRATGEKKC